VLTIAAWYGMLLLLHHGRLQQVKVLSLVTFWLAVTVMAVVYGGLRGPAVVTYLSVVFAASLILGAHAGSGFAAFSLLAIAGMLWAEARGLMPVGLVEPTPHLVWAGLTANLVLAALFVYLAAGNIYLANAIKYGDNLNARYDTIAPTFVDDLIAPIVKVREQDTDIFNICGSAVKTSALVDEIARVIKKSHKNIETSKHNLIGSNKLAKERLGYEETALNRAIEISFETFK
jgi:hypothetical protein